MIEAALALAARGVAVFPVGADKAPRTPRGFHDASTDPDVIKSWGWAWLEDGVMIGSPPAEGVVVIDVDPRNGGDKTLALFPALPLTRTVRTRSGGSHFYLRIDPHLKLRGVLGPGVDVKRHAKGYTVIPPSPGYVWVRGGQMAQTPLWLIDELVVEDRMPGEAAAAPKYFPFQKGTPYGEASLRNALARLSTADNGSRNDELNKAAFGLAQLEAGGELSRDAALDGLLRVAEEIGLSDWEARHTIESGWTAGMKLPRQAPAVTA